MQKYFNNVADSQGNAIAGASVTVTTTGGLLATIFSDNASTPQANPMTTDQNGYFAFYAADGRYNITISGARINPSIVITDILLEDPADSPAVTIAALAAPGGSNLVGFTAAGAGAVTRTAQDKMRDVVSVKDFGAVGGGSTEDGTAFSLADATGDFVRIPRGDYKRGGNVNHYPGGAALRTVQSSDADQSTYGENVQVTNPTGKTGYGLRFAFYNHTGDVSSGLNDIGTAMISRWASISSGSAWNRWDVVSSPLPVGSGLTGAPTIAQVFALVNREINPQNRNGDPGGWQPENRLWSNWVGGDQMVAETQDFSALLGNTRIGYSITFAYAIAKSPYAGNYGGSTEHAKFYNGWLINPNAIEVGGFGWFATGHKPYLTAVAISAAGSGYAVGDILTFNTGLDQTLNENSKIKILTVNGAGAITSCEIWVAGSYSQSFATPIGVTGGTGSGATFTYTLSTSAKDPRAWGGMSGEWLYGIDACPNPAARYATFSGSMLRAPNNQEIIRARNAADNGDITVLKVNSSDQIELAGQKILARSAWTPTLSADSGAFTTANVINARYSQINKIVQFSLTIQIVTVGTATGALIFTIPVAAAAFSFACSGINASDGYSMQCFNNSGGTTVRCTKYDGTNPLGSGKFYTITGTYEAA